MIWPVSGRVGLLQVFEVRLKVVELLAIQEEL